MATSSLSLSVSVSLLLLLFFFTYFISYFELFFLSYFEAEEILQDWLVPFFSFFFFLNEDEAFILHDFINPDGFFKKKSKRGSGIRREVYVSD